MYAMPYWNRKTILYSTLLKATPHCELWSHSHWNLVDFAISSSFEYCLRHVRNKFFFTLIVRWKNAAECVDLNNKTLITEQEVYIFVEEQQNLSSKWANLGVSKFVESSRTTLFGKNKSDRNICTSCRSELLVLSLYSRNSKDRQRGVWAWFLARLLNNLVSETEFIDILGNNSMNTPIERHGCAKHH